MATKKTPKQPTQAEKFRQEVLRVMDSGYQHLPMKSGTHTLSHGQAPKYDSALPPAGDLFHIPNPIPTPVDGKGTKGLGYIAWGRENALPNNIAILSAALPYTAASHKFNVDTIAGVGPKLMYRWTRFLNGTVVPTTIDYADVGMLIRGRLLELREKEAQIGPDGKPVYVLGKGSKQQIGTIADEIRRLEEDYTVWETTQAEVARFTEENNLPLVYLENMNDDDLMDICFPQIELSQGMPGEPWTPKIVGISHRPNVCCRMEAMDAEGRINYVYYSERWRKESTALLKMDEIIAIPALMPATALKDLRATVRSKRGAGLRSRPTRFIIPISYPSVDHPYYPHPAWWSILPSRIYEYATTLISDKAIARANSNMWGKIVFVHHEYLKQLYAGAGATTPEKMEEVNTKMWTEINEFLKDKSNQGKTLLAYKFNGSEGKEIKAFEIVDVPTSNSGADTKDELEEIANIIFFAREIHPSLIGAVPGKSGSSGGTDKRELFMLTQLRMSIRRKLHLSLMDVVHRFNGWDPKGFWVIPDQVLTTLDASKTGVKENINA